MNIILSHECKADIREIIDGLDINDLYVMSLISKSVDIYDEKELLSIINSINNQGITEINLRSKIYKRVGNTIHLSSMGSAEKLFLLCYIASKLKKDIYIKYSLWSLSLNTMKLFFKTFGDCPYITIVLTDSESYRRDMLCHIKGEV